MSWQDELQQLSDDVKGTFGESVTVTRRSSQGVDVAAGAHVYSEETATLTADVQERRQFGDSGARVEELVYLFDVAAWAASALGAGGPREKDIITHGGIARRVVRIDLQVGGKVWRVTVRTEKKQG